MKPKLAVLLYGLEEDKAILKEIMDKLQSQLDQMPHDEVDVVFYTDNGETSVDEKKSWLIGQTESKHYVFVDKTTPLPDNFMLYRLNFVKNLRPTRDLINLGIFQKDVN